MSKMKTSTVLSRKI